MHKVLKAS